MRQKDWIIPKPSRACSLAEDRPGPLPTHHPFTPVGCHERRSTHEGSTAMPIGKVTQLLNKLATSPNREVKQFAIERAQAIKQMLAQQQASLPD